MTNKFLSNAKQGKNDFWRYCVSSFMTLGVAEIVAFIFLFILIAFQQLFIGNTDFDSIISIYENHESFVGAYFISVVLSFSISTIYLFIFLKVLHKRDIMSLINTVGKYDISGKMINLNSRIRWNRFFHGILIWSIFIIIMETVAYLLYPSDFVFNLDMGNFLLLFLLFLIAIPVQVSMEELFFRGYLNQGLSLKFKNPFTVIFISSFLFGLAHLLNGDEVVSMTLQVLSAFIVGIIWSIYTLLDNGIELATGAHLANNFFAFVIVGEEGVENFGTLFAFKSSDPFADLFFAIVPLLVFLVLLYIYKKDKISKLKYE